MPPIRSMEEFDKMFFPNDWFLDLSEERQLEEIEKGFEYTGDLELLSSRVLFEMGLAELRSGMKKLLEIWLEEHPPCSS